MTTDFSKADFYSGLHEDSQYLGTITTFGSPWNIPLNILLSTNKTEYEELIDSFLDERGVVIREWDHLWPDSRGTDYSYFFHEGKVYCSIMGDKLFDPVEVIKGEGLTEATTDIYPRFPLMSKYNAYIENND
jgi:hypothetical protein